MEKVLRFVLLLVSAIGFSQGITVSPNAYTTNQLVNTVLVKNPCLAQVTNVSKRTGTDFGYTSGNGIGYFTNTNPNFPMASGVVLTSGNAVAAQGPNTNTSSFLSPSWLGDTDMNAATGISTINATVLEFNFTPATPNLSIDYMFASEEYGQWQCVANDGMVILLTNLNTGVTTNITSVPNTALPVTVGNIRNILYNSACASVNAAYFGQFNGGGAAATSAINYEGQTVMMNASATVAVGVQYHIKIVVADDGSDDNGEYDSAVFFPEGSFNLGNQVLGDDHSFANNNALCEGDFYTINTLLSGPEYNLSWTRNGSPIAGGSSITITQPGTYALTVQRSDIGCTTTQSVVVDFAPQITPSPPNDLYACENPSGNYVYDLSLNTPVIKEGLDPATMVTYHSSQAAADAGTGALPLSYTGTQNQTIYARVKSHNSSCYVVVSFQLLVMPPPIANQPPAMSKCESAPGSGTAQFDLTSQNGVILGAQPINENTIVFFTSQANADTNTSPILSPTTFTSGNQTIYARVQRNFDGNCYAVASFNLVVVPTPTVDTLPDVTMCNSYTLPPLTNGNYYTGPNGTGLLTAAGVIIDVSQTMYIYSQTTTTPPCTAQSDFDITILQSGASPDDVTACTSYVLPALPLGQHYYNGPGGTGGEIPSGTVITATTQIYFYIPDAAACTQNSSFTVTITTTPVVDDPADVMACGSYTLPALTNGNYFTGPNGTGTQLIAGTVITAAQTLLYVYISNPGNAACTAQNSFTITIGNASVTPQDDVTRCGIYTLPVIADGDYYTGPNGTGNQLSAGQVITVTQTIYIFDQSTNNPACTAQDSVVVTINPLPTLAAIDNIAACPGYTLPALPAGANYYTGPNATGTMLPAGTEITTTQTIYAITQPNQFGCRRQRSFVVTIIDVEADNPGDQDVCGGYVLPALAAGDYYTGPGGTGTLINPGTNITTTQTIYVYVVSDTTPICTAESSFVVTVTPLPVISPIPNVVACTSYTLPALTTGNYYTAANGGGTIIPAGTVITTTQNNIYAYASNGDCSTQRIFRVTIINGDIAPADVTACTSYVLPALPIGSYRTGPSGTGTVINAGTVITTTQTIYVYAQVTSGANCTNDDAFVVTIAASVPADDPADVVACFSYMLPPLTNGVYRTGANGGGAVVPVGTVITQTQTLYVYNSNPAIPGCFTQNSFLITINKITVLDQPDRLVCEVGYVLQPISVGHYFTGPNGTGSLLPFGTTITTNQTIYIYGQTNTNPACSDEESFTVTIKPSPVVPDGGFRVSCGNYILPPLDEGGYFTGTNGTGTQLAVGQEITTSQTIYIFAQTGGTPNCTVQSELQILINPEPPIDVSACGEYVLPPLPIGDYYTGPAGTGTLLPAGTIIGATQDLYVYIAMDASPNCTDNNVFTITVNEYPVLPAFDDVVRCDVYELPVLALGNYYSEPGGLGTLLPAGAEITESQTVYVYAETATVPNCTDEAQFEVTIHHTPVADARSNVERCFSYALDPLTVGNYFALPGGPTATGDRKSVV